MDEREVVNEQPAQSFGSYLKTLRLRKGISLEQVSRVTKLTRETLLRLEREELDAFPAEIFVKGFLKAYAEALGADAAEVVSRYDAGRARVHEQAPKDGAFVMGRPCKWRVLAAFFALFALISATLMIVSSFGGNQVTGMSAPPAVREAPVPDPTREIEGERGTGPVSKPGKAAEKLRFTLQVNALEPTWIKALVDGGSLKRYQLEAGDVLEIEARRGYNLLIGNAGAVRLALDGKPVRMEGGKGQAVNVRIP